MVNAQRRPCSSSVGTLVRLSRKDMLDERTIFPHNFTFAHLLEAEPRVKQPARRGRFQIARKAIGIGVIETGLQQYLAQTATVVIRVDGEGV